MAHELTLLILQYGLLVVCLSVLVEQVGIPVPAFPVLIVAGASAAGGHLSLVGVVLAGLVGCLLPDLLWFWLGRCFGARVMRSLCRISISPDSCVHRSELHFERWRGRSLLIAKFVPGLSLVAPPLVGALGLRLRAFLQLDAMGALLWVAFGAGLGYLFASQVDRLLVMLASAGRLTLAVILGLLVLYVFAKWQRRRRLRHRLRMPRVTPAELSHMILGHRAPLILDVRSDTSRQLDPRAIIGARLVDPDQPERLLHDVPLDREIVSYCNCPNEATSAKVAKFLMDKGFADVRPLSGGLQAWEAVGYPVRPLAPGIDFAPVAIARTQL